MKPGDFDAVAVSQMLRGQHSIDIAPEYFLDPPVCLGTDPVRYEVEVHTARMTYEHLGTRVVRWTEKGGWSLERKQVPKPDNLDPLGGGGDMGPLFGGGK